MDYSNLQFEKFIPRFMRGESDNAGLCAGLSALLKARAASIKHLSFYEFLGDLTAAECDFLAVCFDVFYYQNGWTLAKKREVLADFDAIRQLAGTKKALEKILQLYFDDSTIYIEEAFQYNGQPYHFRIFGSSPEIQAFLPLLFQKAKRTSQVLDCVYIGIYPKCELIAGIDGYSETAAQKSVILDDDLNYYYCIPPGHSATNSVQTAGLGYKMSGLTLTQWRNIWEAWNNNADIKNNYYFCCYRKTSAPYLAKKCSWNDILAARTTYGYAAGFRWNDGQGYANEPVPILTQERIFNLR